MLKSMTGYGSAENTLNEWTCHVTIRSVNSKYLDISILAPKACEKYDAILRKIIKKFIARGKVRIEMQFFLEEAPASLYRIQHDVLNAYVSSIQDYLHKDHSLTASEIIALLQLPSAMVKVDEAISEETIQALMNPTLEDALQTHSESCLQEGAWLLQDMLEKLGQFDRMLSDISVRAPELAADYSTRFYNRLQREVEAGQWDDSRIIQEVAIFSEKAAIDEEIVRLQSHIQSLSAFLAEGIDDTKGKKCDFYLQEMNREVNTIGSKVNDVLVTQRVVELKDLIEKMREQVQNIA